MMCSKRQIWHGRGVWPVVACCCVGLAGVAGCHRDMHDQPRIDMYEQSDFFADGLTARPVIAGTVARGELHEDEALYTGKSEGKFVSELPVEVDRALLERGQQRFNIYCSVCHAVTGQGDGMIVQRGFRRPPSLHIPRLRDAAAGHYFDVITNGFGAMPSYAVQIPPRDRWAIVAYVRVLQLSQHAAIDDVPADERQRLQEASP